MILTGDAITIAHRDREICITPYDLNFVNPASYDLSLGNDCITYDRDQVLDPKTSDNEYKKFSFDTMVLNPGILYLMHTLEVINTKKYVTVIDGKSSLGRLGISVHQTAGYGDPGFNGQYTLEVTVVHPVRVYAGMRFCQARFHTLEGEITDYQNTGRYTNLHGPVYGPQVSRAFRQV